MHCLAVCVKEWVPFTWDISPGNSADSYLCLWLALFHSISYFFFLYQSPSSSLCTVFDSITSNVDDVFSIKPLINLYVSGSLNSAIIFKSSVIISNDLFQMVKFPTRIPVCDSLGRVLLVFFLSSDFSISSTVAVSVCAEVPSNFERNVLVIIWEITCGTISLKSVLLLLVNFVSVL